MTGTLLRREGVSGAEGPLIRKNLRLSRTKEGGGAAKKRVEMKSAEKKGYIGNRERREALHHAFQQRWRGRGENWKLGLGRRERKESARLERGKGERRSGLRRFLFLSSLSLFRQNKLEKKKLRTNGGNDAMRDFEPNFFFGTTFSQLETAIPKQ